MEGSSNHRGAQRTQSSQSQQNKSSCRLRFREIIDAQDWATILCDIAIIIVIIVISTLNPTTRPFLTYDATISAPYQTTNSIPYWLACIIPFLSLLFSLTIWEILPYRNTPRLTSAAASFLFFLLDFIFCFVVTVLLTETGKLVVGRYRPDWLNRCEPDASNTTIVLQWGTSAAANPSCTSSLSPSKIEDGHKSFPSGHASTAFALGVYVAGYVLWSVFYRSGQRLYYSTRREQAVKERVVHELGMACAFLWILFQLSWAYGVALSRIIDNKHHPSDVVGGGFLGTLIGVVFVLRAIPRHSIVKEDPGVQPDETTLLDTLHSDTHHPV